MLIYFMRHGETDWNVARRMQGRSDIPLNDNGLAQAQRAAQGMAHLPIDRIVASPLIRAQQTAQAVAQGREVTVETEELLIEMGFGELEGLRFQESPECKLIFNHPDQYVPVPGGESYQDLDKRSLQLLDWLREMEGKYHHVVLVSHGATIKAVVRILLQRPFSQFWCDPPQANCSCTILECKDGQVSLVEQGKVF